MTKHCTKTNTKRTKIHRIFGAFANKAFANNLLTGHGKVTYLLGTAI